MKLIPSEIEALEEEDVPMQPIKMKKLKPRDPNWESLARCKNGYHEKSEKAKRKARKDKLARTHYEEW